MEKDSRTFLSVLEACKGIIYKIARSYCRDEEDRKDLIQEIITQLWLSFPRFDDSRTLSTWVYRIALNVSISSYRRDTRYRSALPQAIFLMTEESDDPTPVEQLYAFIRELKEIDRAIILLYLEEKPQHEIAGILGMTPSAVSTRMMRIRELLKQNFKKN